jgi:DNA-binding response OmpR family regulator
MEQPAPEPVHRILVVDDEPNIVDAVAMALRFQGFAVESAATAPGGGASFVVELPAAPGGARA